MSNITSNRVKVVDRIPNGLIFQQFVTTAGGSIGAVARSDGVTRCGGHVVDYSQYK